MKAYIFRRFLLIFPTMIGITLITFVLTRFVPGGPIEQALIHLQFNANQSKSINASRDGLSEEDLNYLKELYGFDKPVLISYFIWLKKIILLDLGESYRYHEPVVDLIGERLHISIYYGLITTFLTYLICIPLGVLKAVKDKTWIDSTSSVLIFVGYAIPSFVFALLLLVSFASELEWFPLDSFTSDDFDDFTFFEKCWDIFHHSVLPLLSYMIGSFAVMTILMKNTMLENLSADYVRTAHAKGLNSRLILFRHVLRNSIIPLAASFGNNISLVFSGSFLIETVFNIDGLGLLGYESIIQRDYPVVLGILFISSLFFLIGNILSDICIACIDPRIRFN